VGLAGTGVAVGDTGVGWHPTISITARIEKRLNSGTRAVFISRLL
jgi:hypothetical protein